MPTATVSSAMGNAEKSALECFLTNSSPDEAYERPGCIFRVAQLTVVLPERAWADLHYDPDADPAEQGEVEEDGGDESYVPTVRLQFGSVPDSGRSESRPGLTL